MLDVFKWAGVIVLVIALVVGITTIFAGVGTYGTTSLYEVQEASQAKITSTTFDTGIVREMMRATWGYDQYGSYLFTGIMPYIFGFVGGMAGLYLLFLAVRLVRLVVG